MILNLQAAIMTAVFLWPIINRAQETQTVEVKKNKKFEAAFEGILGLSYSNETFSINVGGPSL